MLLVFAIVFIIIFYFIQSSNSEKATDLDTFLTLSHMLFNYANFGVDILIIYMLMQFKKSKGLQQFRKVCQKKFLLNLKQDAFSIDK